MTQDMYGNEVQCNTPTTRLLAERKRKKNVVESDGATFKLATRISQPIQAKLAADYLRNAAREIEEHNVPVTFEFPCEEVKAE